MRTSGPKKEEATEKCRTLHNEELRNLFLANIVNGAVYKNVTGSSHIKKTKD
jgi:hypothetical protein